MRTAQRLGAWVGIAVGLSAVACQDVRQPVAPIGVYSVGYSTCETIDASGGSVSAGPYSLTIPANALTQSTEICIEQTNFVSQFLHGHCQIAGNSGLAHAAFSAGYGDTKLNV